MTHGVWQHGLTDQEREPFAPVLHIVSVAQ